jgi:purine-cytosine permease-like protein
MKYFKILTPLSVVLIIIGILYIAKLSTIMGVLNLFFGALGLYFSWKYSKPGRKVGRKAARKK